MVLLSLAFFFVVGGIALGRYWRFGQPLGLDNAYFFQRVWQSVFLAEPHRTLLNTELGNGLISGRHFEPILIAMRPIVALFPKMEALILTQVAVVAAGGVGAYLLAKSFVRDQTTAVIIGITWLMMPGLWSVAIHDFRTLAFSAPLIVLCHASIVRGGVLASAVFTILALSCREEVLPLLAITLPLLWFYSRSSRREVAVSFVCCLCWVGLLGLVHAEGGGFISPRELLEGSKAIFEPDNVSEGGHWLMLAGGAGGGLLLGVVAPLALVPIFANGVGVVATGELGDVESVRLFSVAFGSMGLLLAVGLGTVRGSLARKMVDWKALWLVRGVALGIMLWNTALIFKEYRSDMSQSLQIMAGEFRPSQFRQDPWELLISAPSNQPMLTQEAFAPMLSARPELYVSDDWRGDDSFQIVQMHVNVALFRPDHEWVERLMSSGFVVTRDVGAAILLERSEPAPALPPITPL